MLKRYLSRGDIDPTDIARQLDAMDHTHRLRELHQLDGPAQAQLFEAARGARPLSLQSMVPASTPPMREVRHPGRNSLPAFRSFAKVFCSPRPGEAELWGYNHTGALLSHCVGPGYYVAYEQDDELLIDYTLVPEDKPESWPRILPNHARLSRFVYHGMVDVLRGVSEHISVGRAMRAGKMTDNWFVLCREPRGAHGG